MPNSPRWARFLRCVRITAIAVLILGLFFLAFLAVHKAVLPAIAFFIPQLKPTFYDLAVYGVYPTREYVSFDDVSPQVNVVRWNDTCADGHVFLGVYGGSVPTPGPILLDARGGLVWFSEEFDHVTNFRMQRFQGQDYLTFWAGHKLGGVGEGALYMLDSNYQVAHKVTPAGDGLWGDLHEFQLTDQGTALITIYNTTTADLRRLGLFRSERGWISDSVFQEIDIVTGELLFQWKASDHLKPERTFYTSPFAGFMPVVPFDFFHINSIQKDSRGNYLVSARHFHTLTYIDGFSGEILWELGGDATDFEDLSDGRASNFKWQHHARWLSEEEGLLTVFDNGVAGPMHVDARTSKASLLRLDTNNMTATHVQSYYPSQKVLSSSQGSVELLPNNHLFTGWGSSGMWAEHDLDGTLLCEVHFGASIVYAWEWVKSYRAYKASGWVGRPSYPPEARISGDRIYVSWNGATEVRHWRLQGRRASGADDEEWEVIDEIEKHEFEESFELPLEENYRHYRVEALDVHGESLGHSHPAKQFHAETSMVIGPIIGVVLGIAAALTIGWISWRTWSLRSKDYGWNWSSWEPRGMLNWGREQYRYTKL